MIDWLSNDILAFAIALVLAGIIIPQILLIAFRKNCLTTSMSERFIREWCRVLVALRFSLDIVFSCSDNRIQSEIW